MRRGLAAVLGAVAAVLILAATSSAAVYPLAPESWSVTGTCKVLSGVGGACSTTGAAGSDSLAIKAEMSAPALGTVSSEAVATSPDFTAPASGSATVSLERQVTAPTATTGYTVALIDRADGSRQEAFSETVEGDSAATTKQAPAALIAGHTYAVEIDVNVKTNVVNLMTGEVGAFRLANVAVTGPDAPPVEPPQTPPAPEGGSGGATPTAPGPVVSSAPPAPPMTLSAATLRGGRLSLKVKCPTACKVALTGMLNRHKAATVTWRGRVTGSKRVALKLKPGARRRVAAKGRMLFRASAATVTWKMLKLRPPR